MNGKKFHYQRMIQETELDVFGHLNNANYLKILEEARWDFITVCGFGLDAIRQTGIGPVILEIDVKFHHELRAREIIEIESQVLSYENKIGKLQQTIRRDEKNACVAVFTIALFDLQARKIIPPTPEWLQAMGLS